MSANVTTRNLARDHEEEIRLLRIFGNGLEISLKRGGLNGLDNKKGLSYDRPRKIIESGN